MSWAIKNTETQELFHFFSLGEERVFFSDEGEFWGFESEEDAILVVFLLERSQLFSVEGILEVVEVK